MLIVYGQFSRRMLLTALDHKYITHFRPRGETIFFPLPRKFGSVGDTSGVYPTESSAVPVMLLAHLLVSGTMKEGKRNGSEPCWSHMSATTAQASQPLKYSRQQFLK